MAESVLTTEETLKQRGGRYGDFNEVGKTFLKLEAVVRESPNGHNLTGAQYHAVAAINMKLARILNGDPAYDDNWRDIAGYATLMVKICNGEEVPR